MRKTLLAIAALWALAGGAVAAPKLRLPAPVSVSPLPAGAKARPAKLVRAVFALKDGQPWATWGSWLACSTIIFDTFKWNASRSELATDRFASIFDEEADKIGLAASSKANLFDEDEPSDGLQVAVRILDMDAQYCSQNEGTSWRGSMVMSAEWQIYDPAKREVVARVETTSGGEQRDSTEDGINRVFIAAFRESTRSLLADDRFRKLMVSEEPAALASSKSPIVLTAATAPARPISEVTGSVVAIFAGNSMGSGFLISDDGYLITNQHVVGSATSVRIRWSDGLESPGEVVRVDRRRDVALVKSAPRAARQPLALRRGTPGVGEAVFAVGTPLDPKLQNTVTKGIVSANRIFDGFAFIQSDVVVDHGNSGGPLVDEKGRVVGITVIKFAPDDGQRGLNLFIPIGDALDFLALKTNP